jgi:hypothetical protein
MANSETPLLKGIVRSAILLCCLSMAAPKARANSHDIKIPLADGCISTRQVTRAIAEDLHFPEAMADELLLPVDLSVDLRGLGGCVALQGLNAVLGDEFYLQAKDDALVVRVDLDKLPADWKQTSEALERFNEVAAPEAVARQNRHFGLELPANFDPQKPLVIVIHGMDGVEGDCRCLTNLMERDGEQSAIFSYPGERPIDESAQVLEAKLAQLHSRYPALHVDLVTESMGGLVARDCLEELGCPGNVDRLIMIAPPNHGSTWAPWEFLLKATVNASRWWNNPEWSPAWMVNEGICEAAIDLEPGSAFLQKLNAQPRRAGVKYTIIAGDRPPMDRFEANAVDWTRYLIPSNAIGWSWMKSADNSLVAKEDRLLYTEESSDGPVSLESARLQGVSDFVAIPADHLAMYETVQGAPPAAWGVIRQRLNE